MAAPPPHCATNPGDRVDVVARRPHAPRSAASQDQASGSMRRSTPTSTTRLASVVRTDSWTSSTVRWSPLQGSRHRQWITCRRSSPATPVRRVRGTRPSEPSPSGRPARTSSRRTLGVLTAAQRPAPFLPYLFGLLGGALVHARCIAMTAGAGPRGLDPHLLRGRALLTRPRWADTRREARSTLSHVSLRALPVFGAIVIVAPCSHRSG